MDKSLGTCVQNSHKAINANYRKIQSRKMKYIAFGITLFPIYVYKKPDMTTAKKDLRHTHISVPKGLEAPAHMMRMSSISSAAVYDCTSQPGVKRDLSFQFGAWWSFYICFKSKKCFLCPSKVIC